MFQGKHCLITGATGGIGRQIALKMAENGCRLFLTSAHITKLEALSKELHSLCEGKINYSACDLNNIKDVNRTIDIIKEEHPPVDILVNCAGIFIVKSIADSTLKDFETTINVNLRAAFMFSQAFSQDMVRNNWGRIINIGSSSAYEGHGETPLYSASKHALLGLSRSLHDGLRKHNVRVFCISPGATKTEMGEKIIGENSDTFIYPEDIAEFIIHIISFDSTMVSDEIQLKRMLYA